MTPQVVEKKLTMTGDLPAELRQPERFASQFFGSEVRGLAADRRRGQNAGSQQHGRGQERQRAQDSMHCRTSLWMKRSDSAILPELPVACHPPAGKAKRQLFRH